MPAANESLVPPPQAIHTMNRSTLISAQSSVSTLTQPHANAASSSHASSSSASITLDAHIHVGTSTHLIGGETLREMEEAPSNDSPDTIEEWKHRLDRDGYVLLRDVLPRNKVLRARQCVCEAISTDWKKIDLAHEPTSNGLAATSSSDEFTATPLLRAKIAAASSSQHGLAPGLLLTGFRGVTHDTRVLDLLEGPELATMFAKLFGKIEQEERPQNSLESAASSSIAAASTSASASVASSVPSLPRLAPPSTFDTKWCRIHGFEEFTDEHTDYYRFEHWEAKRQVAASNSTAETEADVEEDGARHMFTCWIPLGDYPIAHGTLVVAEGTHLLSGYKQGVYDLDSHRELPPGFEDWRDGTSSSPKGIWRTTHFHPGDIVIFDIRLIHASTRNTTRNFRISMDTRWKPTKEVLEGQAEAFNDLTQKVQR